MLALERDSGKLTCVPGTYRSHDLDGQVRSYRMVKYSYRSLATRKPTCFLGGMFLGVFWQLQSSDRQGRSSGEELSDFEH